MDNNPGCSSALSCITVCMDSVLLQKIQSFLFNLFRGVGVGVGFLFVYQENSMGI